MVEISARRTDHTGPPAGQRPAHRGGAWAVALLVLWTLILTACTVRSPGMAGSGTTPEATRRAQMAAAATAGNQGSGGILQTLAGQQVAGTLTVERDIEVTPQGQVIEVRRLVATDRLAGAYRNQASTLAQGSRAGWTFTATEGQDGYTVSLRREYPDFAAFNLEQAGTLEYANSPFFDQVTYRNQLAGGDVADLSSRFPGPEGVLPDQWADYLGRSIVYAYKVTLPNPVTGGNMAINGRTAAWRAGIGALGPEPVELVATARAYQPEAIRTGLGSLAGVLVLLAGVWFWRRRLASRRSQAVPPAA